MLGLMHFSRARCLRSSRLLGPGSAALTFFEPCLSFARQTRKPRNQLIDRNVNILVNGVALDITSRQSQSRADGKYTARPGFLAEHNLCTQNVGGETRQARDFFSINFRRPKLSSMP